MLRRAGSPEPSRQVLCCRAHLPALTCLQSPACLNVTQAEQHGQPGQSLVRHFAFPAGSHAACLLRLGLVTRLSL